MGGYNIEADNFNIVMRSAGSNASQYQYASVPSSDKPISAVNPELTGGSVGDKLVLRQVPNPMPESSPAGDYIVQQRTIMRNEKLADEGNIPATDEEIQAKIQSYKDLEEYRKLLVDKCNEAGISFSKLSVLMTSLTGKTPKEFHMMNPNFQALLLNYIIESIDRVVNANLPDVDPLEAVVADAAMMYKFVFYKDGEKVDVSTLTPEKIKEQRKLIDEEYKARKAKKYAEYQKLSPEEQKVAKEKFLQQMALERKHIYETLSKNISFESALELLLIVSVQDLGEEAKALMESLPVEIREKIANTMHNIDTFKEYINSVKGRGEDLGEEKAQLAIKQYNKIFGTYKTKENLEAYHDGFLLARDKGELPEEVLKPTAMGIGEAAYANINMTSEEKHVFIQRWVSVNQGFLTDSDMAEVEKSAKDYIKGLLDKNPELKDRISFIKKSIKEIVEKTLNREFKPQKNVSGVPDTKENKSKNNAKYNAEFEYLNKFQFISNPQVSFINNRVIDFVKEHLKKEAAKFECPSIEKSDSQVATALLRGIITEDDAIKNLNNSEHNFVKLCVKNSRLTDKFEDRITNYIKSETDDDKLRELAQIAPRRIVEKIIKNMKGNKSELAEELIKMHEIDHNTVVLLKNDVMEIDETSANRV